MPINISILLSYPDFMKYAIPVFSIIFNKRTQNSKFMLNF